MNHNPGNLANDRQKASEAGKKGGRSSGAASPTTVRKRPKPDARVAETATAVAAPERTEVTGCRWQASRARSRGPLREGAGGEIP